MTAWTVNFVERRLTVKFSMVGVRFLDLDFIAIKLPSLRLTGYLIRISCTVNFLWWRSVRTDQHGGQGCARSLLFGRGWMSDATRKFWVNASGSKIRKAANHNDI